METKIPEGERKTISPTTIYISSLYNLRVTLSPFT